MEFDGSVGYRAGKSRSAGRLLRSDGTRVSTLRRYPAPSTGGRRSRSRPAAKAFHLWDLDRKTRD